MNIEILQGDCASKLRELPDASVQCCVTSPPYWGLRDYGTADWVGGDSECDHLGEIMATHRQGSDRKEENKPREIFKKVCGKCGAIREDKQLGLESTPEEYVENMVQVFREVHRVLRDDGTLWLNLGDSYGKEKQLAGIPWRVAFALQADGWYLRQDIIWRKPNPMPESVTDRCTKSHEYIFLLSKNKKYYYDHEAIKEPVSEVSLKRAEYGWDCDRPSTKNASMGGEGIHTKKMGTRFVDPSGRNKRSVWTVTTKPFKGAHFATFPPDLIKPCILAGTSEKGCCTNCGISQERVTERITQSKSIAGEKTQLKRNQGLVTQFSGYEDGSTSPNIKTTGWKFCCSCDVVSCPCTVLDPFAGAGTTGLVAKRLGCDFIGIELNPEYAEMARTRIENEQNVLF